MQREFMQHVKTFKAVTQCFLNCCFSNKLMREKKINVVWVRMPKIKPNTMRQGQSCFSKEVERKTNHWMIFHWNFHTWKSLLEDITAGNFLTSWQVVISLACYKEKKALVIQISYNHESFREHLRTATAFLARI